VANIYLSSTSEDLRDYRAAAYAALRELRHDVRQMEHFTAASATPAEVSVKGAAEAQVCVVLVAWRYGSVPKMHAGRPNEESFTVLEYRTARDHRVPTLAFLLDDDAPWPKKWIDEPSDRIVAFRRELQRDLTVATFTTKEELAQKVAAAVTLWEKENVPLNLVTPVASETPEASELATIAWGVIATGAHRSPYTGAGITVGILDTGIDRSHEAFAGIDITARNFTGDGIDPNVDPSGHGTHTAGVICGRSVNGQRIGVAPGVQRLLVAKVLGPSGGSNQSLFNGALWVAQEGAQVVLISAGIDFPGFCQQLINRGLPTELAAARTIDAYRFSLMLFESLATICTQSDRPCLLVAPCGNESRRDQNTDYLISACLPGAARGFISVAALQRATQENAPYEVAPFSNTGADLIAPGVVITSAAPGGTLSTKTGTTRAASHVAGVAALWAEKLSKSRGRVDIKELAARLRGQADTSRITVGVTADDVGCGLVQAPRT